MADQDLFWYSTNWWDPPAPDLLQQLYTIAPPRWPDERDPPAHLLYLVTPATRKVTVVGLRLPLNIPKIGATVARVLQSHGGSAHALYLVSPRSRDITLIDLRRAAGARELGATIGRALVELHGAGPPASRRSR